jgi:hypothetical protein
MRTVNGCNTLADGGETLSADGGEMLARYRRKREAERDHVIAEFGGDMRALASELIHLRRSVGNVAESVRWALAGAPHVVLGPGPFWRKSAAAGKQT